MVIINKDLCTACGTCISDCFTNNIVLSDGHATIQGDCMKCGHCIAVCPENAVAITEYNMEDVKEYQDKSFEISADTLLNFIKFRRSTRRFKRQEIEEEKIQQIIEAGRYIPTGGNRQNVRYILVKQQLQALRGHILKRLSIIATETNSEFIKQYGERFIAMHEAFLTNPDGEDFLFFHAPVILLTVSDDILPAALASTGMELEANALGIGCLFSGFSTNAINADADCRKLLGLSQGENAVTALIMGYPDVTYLRTVPRKAPEVTVL